MSKGLLSLIRLVFGVHKVGQELVEGENVRRRLPLWWRLLSWVLIGLGGGAAGLGMTEFTPLDNEPWVLLMGAGIGALLWLLGVGGAMVSKRFGVHDYPVFQLFGLMPALGLLFFGAGGAAVANGILDPHPVEEYETVVVEKFTVGSGGRGGGESLLLQVADFREGYEGKTLKLSAPDIFSKVDRGDKVIVTSGRGLLDWWVADIQMSRKAP